MVALSGSLYFKICEWICCTVFSKLKGHKVQYRIYPIKRRGVYLILSFSCESTSIVWTFFFVQRFFEGVVYSSIKRYTEFCQSLKTDLILSLVIELFIPNLINMAVL